jgi:lipopolysaccharide transport system permease protein
MASTVERIDGRWQALTGALIAQRGGLRLYQWLWITICVIGALLVATPRIISQPILYTTTAETRFDLSRYGPIYNPVLPGVTGIDIAIADTNEALRQRFLARGDVRFGAPDFRVEFIVGDLGTVTLRGFAPTASEAQMLANAAAEELARQVRSAGGREILRNMMGWELWVALEPEGAPAPDTWRILLRDMIRTQAFPMSRDLEPFSTPRDLATLPREEQSDVARALEVRSDLWRFAINTRNATLDALCGTANLTSTSEREAALEACSATNALAAAERIERDREIARLRAVDAALVYVLRTTATTFDPDLPSAAHRVGAALPSAAEPRYVPHLIALAALLGLGFGAAGVGFDRQIGLLAKAQEIWAYRELIRNLVLRDLRTRYKGSALGYLWTQLAPLGMMLVYVLVFSLLLPSGLAQFPVFIITGLLVWNFTAEAVVGGTRSVMDNAALVKKVYFPREVLPLVSVFSSLLNFVLSLPMMIMMMAIVQLVDMGRLNFSWTFAYVPVLLIIQTVLLAGLALFLSAVAVFFRDIVHLVGIGVNIWFFLTPVIYPLSTLGDGLAVRIIRWLNPMASLVEFYREIFYGSPVPIGQIPTPGLPALSSVLRVGVTALVIAVLGAWFFQRSSRRFGEEL